MSRHMRTTIRMDNAILTGAKEEAARRGITLTSLIEQGVRLMTAQKEETPRRERVTLPVSSAGGGLHPGVDLANRASLLDIMEER